MRSKFDEQLKNLNDELIKMGTMIEENIIKSIDALVKNDTALAQEIMNDDVNVDKQQRRIEGLCFNLLIQQQPVAKDLRLITAAMKIVTDMERIGDHAADISEITIMLSDSNVTPDYGTIKKMASEASVMLIHSVDAFTEKSKEKAHEVIEHDDIVDDLFIKAKKELVAQIKSNDHQGELEIDMLMIAKYLERIADHATNIAEWVIYSLNNKIDDDLN